MTAGAKAGQECQCGLWQTSPDFLRGQGIPEGFCGICQVCGRPGHTRHFPGPVPYTGSWCDSCHRSLAKAWPFRSLAFWFMVLVFGISALSLYRFIDTLLE